MVIRRKEKTMEDACNWAPLDKLRTGRFGEYFARMAFARSGYDVYSPEVDDRAIDLLVRIDGASPRYLELQVKTVRVQRPSYVFARKKHFAISPDRFLILVVLDEGREPELFAIPSTVWRSPQRPFVSRDYEGRKSDPEYGLTVSKSTLPKLEGFRFRSGFECRS